MVRPEIDGGGARVLSWEVPCRVSSRKTHWNKPVTGTSAKQRKSDQRARTRQCRSQSTELRPLTVGLLASTCDNVSFSAVLKSNGGLSAGPGVRRLPGPVTSGIGSLLPLQPLPPSGRAWVTASPARARPVLPEVLVPLCRDPLVGSERHLARCPLWA